MVQPVDAATVILTCDSVPVGSPWQCFMVRRHVRSEFAADVFVFPGGKLDPGDRDPELTRFCVGHPGWELEGAEPEQWRCLRLAAIRELFEEAGVLLARHRNGKELGSDTDEAARLAEYRGELQEGRIGLLHLAQSEDLEFALDELHQISRWITPEGLPRRFDTRFFVAKLPSGQQPAHDDLETTASLWISPRAALEQHHRGSFPLVFPTVKHLERLARYPSIDGLIAAVSPQDLDPIMPRVIEEAGQSRFVLPGEPGY